MLDFILLIMVRNVVVVVCSLFVQLGILWISHHSWVWNAYCVMTNPRYDYELIDMMDVMLYGRIRENSWEKCENRTYGYGTIILEKLVLWLELVCQGCCLPSLATPSIPLLPVHGIRCQWWLYCVWVFINYFCYVPSKWLQLIFPGNL